MSEQKNRMETSLVEDCKDILAWLDRKTSYLRNLVFGGLKEKPKETIILLVIGFIIGFFVG